MEEKGVFKAARGKDNVNEAVLYIDTTTDSIYIMNRYRLYIYNKLTFKPRCKEIDFEF